MRIFVTYTQRIMYPRYSQENVYLFTIIIITGDDRCSRTLSLLVSRFLEAVPIGNEVE